VFVASTHRDVIYSHPTRRRLAGIYPTTLTQTGNRTSFSFETVLVQVASIPVRIALVCSTVSHFRSAVFDCSGHQWLSIIISFVVIPPFVGKLQHLYSHPKSSMHQVPLNFGLYGAIHIYFTYLLTYLLTCAIVFQKLTLSNNGDSCH